MKLKILASQRSPDPSLVILQTSRSLPTSTTKAGQQRQTDHRSRLATLNPLKRGGHSSDATGTRTGGRAAVATAHADAHTAHTSVAIRGGRGVAAPAARRAPTNRFSMSVVHHEVGTQSRQ